jgi:hypothetical protein
MNDLLERLMKLLRAAVKISATAGDLQFRTTGEGGFGWTCAR